MFELLIQSIFTNSVSVLLEIVVLLAKRWTIRNLGRGEVEQFSLCKKYFSHMMVVQDHFYLPARYFLADMPCTIYFLCLRLFSIFLGGICSAPSPTNI